MGGRGGKSSITQGLGMSEVLKLNTWNDRIYVNGLPTGSEKIWIEKTNIDWGSPELNAQMSDWEVKYSARTTGSARYEVENSSSEFWKEMEKITKGRTNVKFDELFKFAQTK